MNDREEGKLSLAQILESTVEPNKRADIDKLIIKLDRLTVGKTIGEGNFGCVFEGFLVTGKGSVGVKVAVKTLQESVSQSMDLKGFVQEAVMMREFQHPNVLGLVGLSEKEPGVPYVVLPFMENGDLLTYVRDPDVQLTLHDVIKFGADIADGMAYLSSLKFVHRDLAARNCMLDSVHRVKVADFGLCRDIYEKGYYTSDNKKQLPIRWMAIESIEHGAYSTKSDVWSLGVVLWEMLTRGVTPYPGVDGWDIINFLRRRRLPAPFFCPDELYCLMMQCWAKDPNLRPTFKALHLELQLLIGQDSLLPSTPKINKKNPEKCPDLQTSNLQSSKTPGASKTETKSEIPKGIPETIVEANGEMTKVHYENTASCMGERTLTVPAHNALPDTTITIPECYSDREVSGTTVKKFHRLVDNYETAPDFKKKTNKPTKKTSFTSVNRNSSLLERLAPGNGGVCEGGGVALTQDSAYFMLEKATDDDSCAADSALQRTQSLMEGSNRARVSTNRLSLTVSNIYV
ncbi:macrophage-stimulating protein receptor-like [Physella acuta]|uniref:macrophage-stimulating protein receptor-like n=1 Tax=Physella acuta TaxID=109671 RepID=UPI0027DB0B07|nr:macrophage-stimulating protein receptor-like [Physella acuta]